MLGVAADLATSKGIAKTTIGDIATAARVSNRTFYEHFTSKEECFALLFRRATVHAARLVIAAAREHLADGPLPSFRSMLATWAEVLHEGGPSVPVLWDEARSSGQVLRTELDRCFELLADILAVAAEQLGSPLPTPARRLTSSILLTGTITTLTPMRLAGALKPKELLDAAALLCRGFSLDETRP